MPTRYKLTAERYIDYEHDTLNRLNKKTLSTGSKTSGAPFVTSYTYKSSARNTGDSNLYRTTQLSTETIGGTEYSYNYSKIGNITSVKKNGSAYRSYEYDSTSQLIRENNQSFAFSKYWNYDSIGNIESVKTYEYTTDETFENVNQTEGIDYQYSTDSSTGWDRLLKKVVFKTYTYDADGNKTTETETKEIDYDAIGNPVKYLDHNMSWFGRQLQTINVGANTTDTTADDKTLTFTYGADGLRGTKAVKTGSTTVKSEYTYVNGLLAYEKRGNSELFFFYDTYSHLTAIRYYADASEDDYKQYYAISNSMGDVIGFVDGNGNVVASYEYDAWGNCEITQDTTSVKIADLNPIRYRGYYWDSETGFYYLQSRYYDPAIGRFLNADTEISGVGGEILGNNMFSYCLNNPVNMSDPTGHWPSWATVALGVAAAVVAVAVTVATLGAAAPAAACTLAAVGMSYGASYAVATTVATVAVAATTVAASAYAADVAYSSVTGDSVLLNTVFQGNSEAYETGMFLTSFATAGMFELAANSPGTCFIAGTLVSTLFGKTKIENIEAGDKVWAENPETGQKELKTVVRTFENESSELVHIFVYGEEITTTPTHPFYVPQKGWTDAIKLCAGDILVLRNGDYVIIEKVQHEILETPIRVYNFEVEDFHTYYVGDSSVLVHNADCGVTSASTGRTTARNLKEQLAMQQVKSNPLSGAKTISTNLNDARWSSSNGWVKMANNVNGVEIHFNYNETLNIFADFKYKD